MHSFTLYDFIVAIYSIQFQCVWRIERVCSLFFFFGIVNKCADTIKIHLCSIVVVFVVVVVVSMTNVNATQDYLCIYFPRSYVPRSQKITSTVSLIVGVHWKLKRLIFPCLSAHSDCMQSTNREKCSNPMQTNTHIIYFHFSRHQETKTIPDSCCMHTFFSFVFLIFSLLLNVQKIPYSNE